VPSPQKEHVMDSQKNDLRVRMTKKRLRKAFAQMMLERPLQNISVAELCIKAEINRSTFYAHYADIFDLQQRLEEEIYLEFQETLSHVNLPNALSVDKVPLFMVTMFDFLKRNADLCGVFLGPYADRQFVLNLLNNAKEITLTQYSKVYKKASPHQLELFYTFIAYGCIGLLEFWMQNGFVETVEEMAEMTNAMILRGAGFLE